MKDFIKGALYTLATIVAWAIVLVVPIMVTPGRGHAAPVEYDPRAAMSRRMIEPVAMRTVQCMREGAENMLRMGMRDDNELATWLATTCGMPLGSLMMSEIGLSQHDAATYLFAMGHAAIRETPGVRRPAR